MNEEKFIDVAGIGVVKFVRNRRARNIAVRINRDGDVRVTVPGNIPVRVAEAFVEKKKSWILSTRERLISRKEDRIIWGTDSKLQIKQYIITIRLKEDNSSSYKVKRESDSFILYIPGGKEPEREEIQEEIRTELWKIITLIGKEVLPLRTRELADRHGLKFKEVKVRKMKSRWGSCSAANVINLSSSLLLLPDHLADYVILHELAHTVHKDHSRKFWSYLDRLTGDSVSLRRELRKAVLRV